MNSRYLVATDASVSQFQGLGWGIIQDLNTSVVRHRAVVKKLKKANASTLMELATVRNVFSKLPNNCSVELINDCQLLHDINFWRQMNWLNSRKEFTMEAQELKAFDDLVREKKIEYYIYPKTYHHFHKECDENCHRFREMLQRGGKMYYLFTLTPEYKAKKISAHNTLIKAQEAANALGRKRIHDGLPKVPVTIALCRDPGPTIRDMKGRTYEVVE